MASSGSLAGSAAAAAASAAEPGRGERESVQETSEAASPGSALVAAAAASVSVDEVVGAAAEASAAADDVRDAAELIVELCRQFYQLGWVTGTGGGVTVRVGSHLVIAPSGVQKERMEPVDLFVMRSVKKKQEETEAARSSTPASCMCTAASVHPEHPKCTGERPEDFEVLRGPPPERGWRPSQCTPLFMNAFFMRGAGAVIHTHSQHALMATLLGGPTATEFRITYQEMIKGIKDDRTGVNLRFFDELVVPIIENTAEERDLQASMAEAMRKYPATCAVLVRRHGVYVWGSDWSRAKTMCECYDYLFEIAGRMRALGINHEEKPPEEQRVHEDR